MSYGVLKFDTEQIAAISSVTTAHREQWDSIWNGVRSKLSATAAEALSSTVGGSLDQRSAEYHAKTQQHVDNMASQSSAVQRVGTTASDYNDQMTRTIAG
ncbi:hypothetical protein GB931_03640 [Modestobacter sp. I12A-02628]|uniref:ESAT-6-like protein n=1 Tax=Goekera deserti TaxID=2497753 RepID=A0A7K3WCN3_9ACTN|nr:hypothetical protein [Goekera deserti]MPQ97031.1 hypothetical protein [Goekera deserti]NDI46653.1 hypothetical protein [Goekera deserti]NEL54222.1 hypothetical protein [Goekera deserti]